jgi:hypothetical protein
LASFRKIRSCFIYNNKTTIKAVEEWPNADFYHKAAQISEIRKKIKLTQDSTGISLQNKSM